MEFFQRSQKTKNVAEELYKRSLELLKERRRTEQLIYNVAEAVIAVGRDLKITLFNSAAERITGVDSVIALDKPIDDIITLETEAGTPIKLSTYCFDEKAKQNSMSNLIITSVDNNKYYVNLKVSTVEEENPEDSEYLITLVDVTKQRLLDKLKNDFISVAAHELRTPMTIIKSYLWMLVQQKAGILNAKQLQYIHKAEAGAERMLNLISDMLDVSKIEQGHVTLKIDYLDAKACVTDIAEEFKIKTDEKHLYLKVELEDQLKYVYADKSKGCEIMQNLLGNAIKFTDTGGITIKANNFGEDFVIISVIDTGRGIRAEDIDKLFKKFSRLDNSYQTIAEAGGTGLGLFISKAYVEQMGGRMGAHSHGLNQGSTFWFTLPTSDVVAKNNKALTISKEH